MIGIVIPACNEERDLAACLVAIQQAIQRLNMPKHEIKVLVVLDSCTDQSRQIVEQHEVNYIECAVHCVGQARDLGIRQMIERGVTWIACTDADSRVDADWLMAQLQHQPADVICGVVEVDDWGGLSKAAQQDYIAHYQDCMGHSHVHGANLSFSRDAYIQAGGFQALECHEDVDLVKRMQQLNLKIVWSNLVRVTTSSRLDARAPQGFAHFLKQIQQESQISSSDS